ncbi:MAG: hypothetical protein LQ345_006925 [Seirophora villosa]|nr:MAG: hypothetical protein LQ345_006925 [Seirophora villosa]
MSDNKASAMASSRAAWLVDRTKNLRSNREHPQRGIRWDYGNNKVNRDREFSSADDSRQVDLGNNNNDEKQEKLR